MSSHRYIEFRCSSEPTAEVETVTFEGRNHLVVPVVALIGNTVIQASNAPTPEYIPANVIEDSVITWNGRPTLPEHPKYNGKAVSANSPRIFDSLRTGFIFETQFTDNKLKMLSYLDIERCNDLGGDAKLAIEKIQSGEGIDVSVGAIVETEEQKGVALDGKEYGAIWIELSGDHLAFLPSSVGACNQSMGCGAPRIAESKENDMADENTPVIAVDRAAEPKRDFFSRLLTKFRPMVIFDDGNSDDELRQSLADAIKSVDPAFDWVCSVYVESGVVIYMTYVIYNAPYYGAYKYWRRTFTLNDGKVVVNNDAIEVQPKRVWETVDEGVEVTPRESGSMVSAESKQLRAAETAECTCQKGEKLMATKQETIGKIKALEVYSDLDDKTLETLSEKQLESMLSVAERIKESDKSIVSAKVEDGKVVVATASDQTVSTPAVPPLTEAAVLAAFPDLNRIITGHRANEAARKTYLITQLAAAQTVYSEEVLKSKPLDSLEEIAQLVGIESVQPVDFSLRGMPVTSNETRTASAPDGWKAALEKNQSTQKAN